MHRSAWFWLIFAVFVLNAALSFHNVWPTPWITLRPELSVEVAALVLALCAAAARGRPPSPRTLAALALLLTVMCIGRYFEVTAPALYGRRINLYWDAQHLPKVAAMLVEAAPAWISVAALAGLATLLAAIFLTLRWTLVRIALGVSAAWPRRLVTVACVGLLAAYAAGWLGAGTLHWFSLPVLHTYAQQASIVHDSIRGVDVQADLEQPALPGSGLSRVAGADVLVVFLESYGAATFDRAELAATSRNARARLARAAADSGRGVVSGFVTSPTFGGASWLAHSSLMSGVRIPDAASYAALLTGSRETLVTRFAAAGYRTLALMPGLKQAWPEGSFYTFSQIYGERALDYRGPAFGWWRIPDQFALAKLDSLELAPAARAPVFLFFPTISTHMPFRPTPPYQPDWTQILEPAPFTVEAVETSLRRTPQWTNLAPSYAQSVDYALTSLSGYLRWRSDRDLVLVLLGDHQPAASVSGPDASWDVPVHIITHRQGVLDALREAGFTSGLEPPRRSLMPMHRLAPLLLEAFG